MGRFKAKYLGRSQDPDMLHFEVMFTGADNTQTISVKMEGDSDAQKLAKELEPGGIIELSHPDMPDYPPYQVN